MDGSAVAGLAIAFSTFIFLGWFLLSVKNKRSSIRFTPVIGRVFEKFKKLPFTKISEPGEKPEVFRGPSIYAIKQTAPSKAFPDGEVADWGNALNWSGDESLKLVANKYNLNHTCININYSSLLNNIEQILINYGEPFADSSAIPSFYVSQEAKKHVTVILNGDGGDELFGGYRRYIPFSKVNFFDFNPLFRCIIELSAKAELINIQLQEGIESIFIIFISIKDSAVRETDEDLVNLLKILSLAKDLDIQIENGFILLLILLTIASILEDLEINLTGVSLTLSE